MFILVRQINCSLSSCLRRGIISVWGIIVITFRIGKKNTEFAFHNANSVHRTYIEMKKLSFYLTK